MPDRKELGRRTLISVATVLVLLSAVGLIAGLLKDGQDGANRAPAETPIAVPGRPLDLLSLVDVDRDAVKGTWKKRRGMLITPEEPEARLEVPFKPPEEYDLRIVLQSRSAENRSFHIGLVGASQRFLVSLDGFGGGRSALENLDGMPSDEAGTVHVGDLFSQRAPVTIVCAVRRNHLSVTLDGKPIIDWVPDYRRLSLPDHWSTPRDKYLLVGVWNSRYEIREMTLTAFR